MTFLERLEDTIVTRKLFRAEQSILVAVSGGVDSMVLLHALHALSEKHHWRVVVAHFNHQLRGANSDADEKLVRKVAKALKLPINVGRADVKAVAARKKLSIEMAAREVRHEFLAKTARTRKIQHIALAHHGDDQVELFLIRLLRGAGSEGLAGMRAISRSPADAKLFVIRPLLDFTKAELSAIAQHQKIEFREDESNQTVDFLRNRIRHEIVPALKAIQPSTDSTILRTMEILRAESQFVFEHALEWLAHPQRAPFDELPIAVQRRVLELQVRGMGHAPEFQLIEGLRHSEKPVSVGPSATIHRNSSGVVEPVDVIVPRNETLTLSLDGSWGETDFDGLKLDWQLERAKGAGFDAEPGCELFDADKVGHSITLRHWQPGDRFQPIGMKSAIKLQDLFVNLKVPRERRHSLVLAETQKGHIFWVEGLRISEQFKLTSATSRRLKWCFRRAVSVIATDS